LRIIEKDSRGEWDSDGGRKGGDGMDGKQGEMRGGMRREGMRVARDAMGEVLVPENVYYGAQTQRAVHNYPISGWRLPRELIRAQGLIKAAAAEANRDTGMLDPVKAAAIIRAAEEVADGKWDDQFVVDVFQSGAGTSQNMNANEVIASRAAEILGGKRGDTAMVHPNDDVNMAQSTNDTMHVAINIAAAEMVHRLVPVLAGLKQALADKAREFHDVLKPGRTHLQDAVPMRLGQEFSGYAATIDAGIGELNDARDGLYSIGLGGNAVGTGINAHPEYADRAIQAIARRTGLPFRPPEDRFAFMQNTGAALRLSGALRNLAVHLIKLSHDLRLLSSGPRTGLAELMLPPVQPGSSIMPGKVNPSMAEMIAMVACQVIGHDAVVSAAAQGSQLEINVMMPVIAWNLLASLKILTQGVDVFTERCVQGITANRERCRELVENSLALATALNPYIGYDRAAEIAKMAYQTGKSLRQVAHELHVLPDEDIDRILNPENMV
jgi:fumarate hydratase class II